MRGARMELNPCHCGEKQMSKIYSIAPQTMKNICKTYTKPFRGTFFTFLLIGLKELNFAI